MIIEIPYWFLKKYNYDVKIGTKVPVGLEYYKLYSHIFYKNAFFAHKVNILGYVFSYIHIILMKLLFNPFIFFFFYSLQDSSILLN